MDYLAGDEFYGDDITSGYCEPDAEWAAEIEAEQASRIRFEFDSDDEYQLWLDEQTEEANLRIDAQGARR